MRPPPATIGGYAAHAGTSRDEQPRDPCTTEFVTFVHDDVLTSHLTGPFDAVFDRGCFHVLAPEHRAGYVETMHRLLAPSGWLFVKTFSHYQPGEQGPHRFAPRSSRGSR